MERNWENIQEKIRLINEMNSGIDNKNKRTTKMDLEQTLMVADSSQSIMTRMVADSSQPTMTFMRADSSMRNYQLPESSTQMFRIGIDDQNVKDERDLYMLIPRIKSASTSSIQRLKEEEPPRFGDEKSSIRPVWHKDDRPPTVYNSYEELARDMHIYPDSYIDPDSHKNSRIRLAKMVWDSMPKPKPIEMGNASGFYPAYTELPPHSEIHNDFLMSDKPSTMCDSESGVCEIRPKKPTGQVLKDNDPNNNPEKIRWN